MKLFADYLKERCNRELLEAPGIGFATYEISGEECYIVDIFISKEHRKSYEASRLADQIVVRAKALGCTYLKGTVDLSTEGTRGSFYALLGYGFEPVRAQNEVVYFRKEL